MSERKKVFDQWSPRFEGCSGGYFITLNTKKFVGGGYWDRHLETHAASLDTSLERVGKYLRQYCLGRAFRRGELPSSSFEQLAAVELGESGLLHAHIVAAYESGCEVRSTQAVRDYLLRKQSCFSSGQIAFDDIDVQPLGDLKSRIWYVTKQAWQLANYSGIENITLI